MNTEFANALLETALKKGADEAEVFVRSSRNISAEAKDGFIDTAESSNSLGYGLRVIKDKRLGFSYSTDPDEFSLVAEQAIEASRHSEPDNCLGLPVVGGQSEINVFDAETAAVSEQDALRYALELERSALASDPRIKRLRRPSVSFSVGNTAVLNSHGVRSFYSSTACSAQVMAISEEGGESQMGWDYSGSRNLRDLLFKDIGLNAAQRAIQLLGGKKITSFKGSVILENSIACEFLGILSSALSSEAVQKNKSMLAGKLGKKVTSQLISVTDSGLLPGRLGSKPSDDEGVAVQCTPLIEQGILNGYLYNTYSGRKDGVASTGNAVRGGFAGLPAVGKTNLFIESAFPHAVLPVSTLLSGVRRGIYVLDTMGMHTANPISGEFSVGISGLLIEDGELKHPVRESVIAGNIIDLFSGVTAVGDDLRFYGNIGAPSLLIEALDISG